MTTLGWIAIFGNVNIQNKLFKKKLNNYDVGNVYNVEAEFNFEQFV